MRKSTKSFLAVSALVLGLGAAPGLYAQQTTDATQTQGGKMQGQMGQDMMGMMDMMQQMSRMMESCAEMMESMDQEPMPQEGQAPEQEG